MKDSITKIVNDWDPIGLFPMAPQNEYEAEVLKIINFTRQNKTLTIKVFASKIDDIFLEAFGNEIYQSDMEKCIQISKEILSLEK